MPGVLDSLASHRPEGRAPTMDEVPPQCRFCGSPAVVLVAMSEGCVCYPDDREQFLCRQHEWKSEPIGSFEVIAEAPWT